MSAFRAVALAVVGLVLVGVTPAAAQSLCSGIADRSARLDCFDRAARTPSIAPQAPAAPAIGACTRSSPCVGPRSGVYYFTSSGSKRYLPR